MSNTHNKRYERKFVKWMIEQGYDSMRIAGSGSAVDAVCDCVYFKDGKTHLVEVKATKEKKFYLRNGVKEQLEIMKKYCEKNGLVPVLAVWYKGRGWELQILD